MTENQKYNLIRITGFVFLIIFSTTLLIFLFFPEELLKILDFLWSYIITIKKKELSITSNFWYFLGCSMMFNIITLSYFLYYDPERYNIMLIPLTITKFSSSLLALFYFIFNVKKDYISFTIFFTDFPLGLWCLFLYLILNYDIFKILKRG
ncbi:MAG: hypothetical protein KatS3mg129_0419 [Leptospiraceae bacterium]|nr:MAG: hypothetical protein KatS3mg129_0419 [Leptospiraceae bacterium]